MKLTAKTVSKGMVFEVASHPFGLNKLGFEAAKDYNPPIGVQVEITKEPFKNYGCNIIQWKEVGKTEEWQSIWDTFKKNTKFISGTPKKPVAVPPVVITSKGPFSGFDVRMTDIEVQDLTSSHGFGRLYICFEFDGKFTGCKNMTDEIYNRIKAAPGFKTHMVNSVDLAINKNKKEIDEMIKKINPSHRYFKSAHEEERIEFWYAGKKVHFHANITTDLADYKKEIEKRIEDYIKHKKTNFYYYD